MKPPGGSMEEHTDHLEEIIDAGIALHGLLSDARAHADTAMRVTLIPPAPGDHSAPFLRLDAHLETDSEANLALFSVAATMAMERILPLSEIALATGTLGLDPEHPEGWAMDVSVIYDIRVPPGDPDDAVTYLKNNIGALEALQDVHLTLVDWDCITAWLAEQNDAPDSKP
ncbi:hypothetical protein KKF84_06145 [Myxococcota bacterium]|nr:hypothetical protein [Myxococcota bacterium]MBU1534880.1 hypothetical protein [Myxococcota bacterium]